MSAEEFQFQYRWADMAARGLNNSLSELEARDQALEQFIKDFPCGGVVPTFELDIVSGTLFAAVMSAPGASVYTFTWVTDVEFTPESIRYTIDSLNNPLSAQFGTYDSGYPGTLTPIEGVALPIPAVGAGSTTYSGFTTIPAGSTVGIKVFNTVSGFNLINTLEVIVSGQSSAAHATVTLGWHP